MYQVEFSSLVDGSKLSSFFVSKYDFQLEKLKQFLTAVGMNAHIEAILVKLEASAHTKERNKEGRLQDTSVPKPLSKIHGEKLTIEVINQKDSDKYFEIAAFLPYQEESNIPF